MKNQILMLMALSSAWSLFVTSAEAEATAPKQKSASTTATLYRVDDGLFDLRAGEVIDLTDRKILLSFLKNSPREQAEEYNQIRVNIAAGEQLSADQPMAVGRRFNLKADYASKLLKDKNSCFLDLVSVAIPKGAPMVATFRFSCE